MLLNSELLSCILIAEMSSFFFIVKVSIVSLYFLDKNGGAPELILGEDELDDDLNLLSDEENMDTDRQTEKQMDKTQTNTQSDMKVNAEGMWDMIVILSTVLLWGATITFTVSV